MPIKGTKISQNNAFIPVKKVGLCFMVISVICDGAIDGVIDGALDSGALEGPG